MMDVTVYHSFEEAEQQWRRMEADAVLTGFQLFDWLSGWHETVGAQLGVEPVIIALENSNGEPIMLWPLGIRKQTSARVLAWLGGSVTDFHGPVLAGSNQVEWEEDEFRQVWRDTIGQLPEWDVVHLEKQPAHIGLRRNPFTLLDGVVHYVNHRVTLDTDWKRFLDSRTSSKFRADSRRRQRRFEELGSISTVIGADRATAIRVTETMIRQKSRRYRETGVLDMFSKPGYSDFYTSLTTNHLDGGFIHVSAMFCNDVVAATHWGMIHDNCFYHIMPSYEGGNYRRYGAGRLLLEALLQWSCAQGLEYFDFTVGEEEYKSRWSDEVLPLYEYFETRSERGRLYQLRQNAVAKIRKSPAIHRMISRLRNRQSS